MHDAKELAKGYAGWFRWVEIASIVTFWSLVAALVWKAFPYAVKSPWVVAAALAAGYVMADFASGWCTGSSTPGAPPRRPVRPDGDSPFREHHVDEKAMTHHDYIETNGANCLVAVPVAAASLLIPLGVQGLEGLGLFALCAIGSMNMWVMMTNQFHKWSHLDEKDMPWLLPTLQRWHLVLNPTTTRCTTPRPSPATTASPPAG